MSRVLVVGGGGYIGVVLCEQLLELGYDVRVLDRLYFGYAGLWGIQDRAEIVVGDMRSVDPAVLDAVDAVVNLGGLSSDPTAEYNPEATYKINTLATRDMAAACKERGIQRYVFASSCSVYDKGVLDDAGTSELRLSGELPAARYFVDCWLKADEKVVDWGSTLVDVFHDQGVAEVRADAASPEQVSDQGWVGTSA